MQVKPYLMDNCLKNFEGKPLEHYRTGFEKLVSKTTKVNSLTKVNVEVGEQNSCVLSLYDHRFFEEGERFTSG